jgi:broad specificity phosphatase PhoE
MNVSMVLSEMIKGVGVSFEGMGLEGVGLEGVGLEGVGLLALLLLLVLVASRLHVVHALLYPNSSSRQLSLTGTSRAMLRKAWVFSYGVCYLFLSSDKLSKRQLAKAHAAQAMGGGVEKEIRLIFVRHGESVWNYVFNRGFGPSFLVRLVRVTLHELYLLPLDDSAYVDSPLSARGLEQCASLHRFLRTPCVDARAAADFAALTSGEASSVLVSSQLRRAACTLAIALADRIGRSRERILLHSSCQEISRNVDTMALAPTECVPPMWLPDPTLSAAFDASANAGNKALGAPGCTRLHDFCQWAAERPEKTIIVAGHSLWFRSFFQLFLPAAVEHPSKKHKLVNCGVAGLTLQVLRDAHGQERYRIDPASIVVVYGGFESKGKK